MAYQILVTTVARGMGRANWEISPNVHTLTIPFGTKDGAETALRKINEASQGQTGLGGEYVAVTQSAIPLF